MSTSGSETLLISRIRAGQPDAWNEFIARYEGRLLGFVIRRVGNRAAAEDLVQETFVGFLNSLPNYDAEQPLESYLFSIAAHKLTDFLRHEGRRPTLPLVAEENSGGWQPVDRGRRASSIVRSRERRGLEESALVKALREMIAHWRQRGQWERLQCIELLCVRGWSNKEVAARLGISEQAVANYKFETIARLRGHSRPRTAGGGIPGTVPVGFFPAIATMTSPFRQPDLEAYLDEALPVEEMTRIEKTLRGDPVLARQLAATLARCDSGVISLGEVWRRHRVSCPTRPELGSFLLGVLPDDAARYVAFHLEVVGCRYCQANVTDLKNQQAEAHASAENRRQKYFQSSAGHLRRT